MDIKFLGCGSGFNPSMGNTSAYFRIGKNLYIIDCGEDVFSRLIQNSVLDGADEITILITHLHCDHCGSLAILVSYCYYVLGRKATVIHPSRKIVELLDLMGIISEAYTFKCAMAVDIPFQIHIEAVEVRHAHNMECFGYIIKTEDDCVFYSGDAAEIPEKVLYLFIGDFVKRMYIDTSSVSHRPASHGYFGYHREMIPQKLRNRVFCMHLDCDFRDMIRNEGFKVIDPVDGTKKM